MYFLLSSHGLFDKTGELKDGILKKDIHEFIAFFTGKHPDNIKKTFKALFTKEDLLDDNLRFIRPYVEKLKLEEAVNQINRQLKG